MSNLSACWLPLTCLVGGFAGAGEDDPNLWLEEIQGRNALAWVHERNAETFADLRDTPVFEQLNAEAYAILTSEARLPSGSIVGADFHDFWQDPVHVRGIWRRTPVDRLAAGKPDWQTVLDLDALARKEGANWVYQSIDCAGGDSDRCLLELSDGGKDESVLREFSLESRDFVSDGFVVPEAKSTVAWVDEDTLIVATDWGPGSLTNSGYPREARLWRRGRPLEQAESLYTVTVEDTLLAPEAYGSAGGRTDVFLLRLAADWNNVQVLPVTGGRAGTALDLPSRIQTEGVVAGRLIVLLKQDWQEGDDEFTSGDVLAVPLAGGAPELVFRPSPIQAIDEIETGSDAVFLQMLDNVRGRIRRVTFAHGSWLASELPLPDNGVAKLAAAASGRRDLFVTYESIVQPTTLYHVAADDRLAAVAEVPALYEASDVVVEQRFARSADGTRIPYFVAGRKAVLEAGDAPTILYGYGGFQTSILPVYYEEPSRPQHGALAGRMWLSRGGVLALGNLRGGGEFGPQWHAAALRENRQRAFDDYIAIAEELIRTGVTSTQRLGALGRSNGGLLLGVALTQRPDLFAAFDIGVPLLDMRRYNKLLAGASWMGEYGNPDVPEDWAFIRAYSPYHNLAAEADYPRVFFYTSTLDDRVHPGHARKMAKALEDRDYEFWYYENTEGGHGGTANQEQLAMRTALEYTYFIRMLMPAYWDRQR